MLLAETSFGIRGGRVGSGRGNFNNGQKRKDRKKNKTLTQAARNEQRVEDIVDNFYLYMTSGHWFETGNRTWVYVTTLTDISDVYNSRNAGCVKFSNFWAAEHFGAIFVLLAFCWY